MTILILILLTALWCNSLKVMLQSGMILHWLYLIFTDTYKATVDEVELERFIFPTWLRKPLYDCAYCMPSIHGAIVYLIYCASFQVEPYLFIYLLVTIPSVIVSGVFREWLINQEWINTIENES